MFDCTVEHNVTLLYRKTGKLALSKTYYIVKKKTVAEEIVQTVFTKLWSAQMNFDTELSAYKWVYTSCHNLSVDYLRSGSYRAQQYDAIEPDDLMSEDNSSRFASVDLVKKILKELSPRDGQILVYKEADGLTLEEIADIMGVSRKTVVRSLAHSLEILRAQKEIWA